MKTIRKNKNGYGYKYADLSQIHNYLEENQMQYYQYTERIESDDYIVTVLIDENGEESRPLRGCRVVQATLSGKSNPAQEQGSALTYARRYSLLMALGLATEDDDAEALTQPKKTASKPVQQYKPKAKVINDQQFANVTDALDAMKSSQASVCKLYGIGSVSDMTEEYYMDFMNKYEKWRGENA